jgi:thiosulfate/3-mercaptopyruvate sulfurtransferase
MSDFSGLPLVIEPSDLLPRLDAPELILVDLTSPPAMPKGIFPARALSTRNAPSSASRPPRPAAGKPTGSVVR